MKSLGSSLKQIFQKKKEIITYEDFDTSDDEDLDMTPEWLKDRAVYKVELEKCIRMNGDMVKVGVKRGIETVGQPGSNTEVAMFKCIII